MKRVVKNHPVSFGTKEVFEGGVKIAEYDFCRNRREVRGRIELRCTGKARYVDGRVVDLSGYCWAADVASDFRNGVL